MTLLSEPDVIHFRCDHYELLTRLLANEPDAALLQSLRDGIADRAVGAAQVHPQMGEGWRVMGGHLAPEALEGLVDEFTRMFLGPYGDVLNPYESYYLTGRLYGQPLADVRGFMARQSLERAGDSRGEPEDSLAFELGIMASLAARQLAGGDVDPAALVEPQREFLGSHLLIWAPACIADMERNPAAAFYKGVALLLGAFLQVEHDFFREDGGIAVEALEAARRRYHSVGFRGPVFDPEQLPVRQADGKGEDK
ncbi:MAG TPA: molecular chaperone TorD family protein [bacterium]|jgi:TorA maturation chaperone TorD